MRNNPGNREGNACMGDIPVCQCSFYVGLCFRGVLEGFVRRQAVDMHVHSGQDVRKGACIV